MSDKTLFEMLDILYKELDKEFYDCLTDYQKGMKDVLNLLDTSMSGNDKDDMFEYMLSASETIETEYYYQIDFIDENGLANYIKTFDEDTDKQIMLDQLNILNYALRSIGKIDKVHYVLDKYEYKISKNTGMPIDDTDEIVIKDIQKMEDFSKDE